MEPLGKDTRDIHGVYATCRSSQGRYPPPTKLEDMIPEPYLGFRDVFSKESFNELPEQKQWDHAIDLVPGSKPFSTKVYPISPVEQKELDDFLDENPSSGCIRPSKLLMASPVFFVKKKGQETGSSRITESLTR